MNKFSINYTSRFFIFLSFVLFWIQVTPGTKYSMGLELHHPNPIERKYIEQKMRGNYERAIQILSRWTINISDPMLIEINIFRICELVTYPELRSLALNALTAIRNQNKRLQGDTALKARIAILQARLHMENGESSQASRLINSLSFSRTFRILGPFSCRSYEEFNRTEEPEKEKIRKELYQGKYSSLSWFDIKSDHLGTYDISALHSNISNTLFYLESSVTVPHSGKYHLYIGKSGFMNIWINGQNIFSNRYDHNFNHDQYRIEVVLPGGKHTIMIKTGNSEKRQVLFSMRLTTDTGKPIEMDTPTTGPFRPRLLPIVKSLPMNKVPFVPILSSLMSKSNTPEQSFYAGYLLYMLQLHSNTLILAQSLFEKSRILPHLTAQSDYYRAMTEKDLSTRELHLKMSLKKEKVNIEALSQLAGIQLVHSAHYKAEELIRKIQSINQFARQSLILQASLYSALGWDIESLQIAERITDPQHSSLKLIIMARTYYARKEYKKAFRYYSELHLMEAGNRQYAKRLTKCLIKMGLPGQAKRILNRMISLYPNSMSLHLERCIHIENNSVPGAAIPYLSSALKRSPYNSSLLMRLGIVYFKIGKKNLARYYLRHASILGPANFSLKRYLRIIDVDNNNIEKFLNNDDIDILKNQASTFSNEPAVILLDETAIQVFRDGSSEERIHRIILINNKSVINDFSQQYIITDPSTERLENIQCRIIYKGNVIEATNIYSRALSDPASRLYYDLQARIINLPSLGNGSIIDLSYIKLSARSRAYRHYYGKKIQIGGNYRTLVTNIVLMYPRDNTIYCHRKGVPPGALIHSAHRNGHAFQISLKNRPPLKNEYAMPHPSGMLPAVYFTSHRNWNDFYHWYYSLLDGRIRVSREMRRDIKKIVTPQDTESEKIRKIYNHVKWKIRYVGFELGIGGIRPRYTDLTYQSRMGDCKDISLVLIALFRQAGLDARLALIRTRDQGKANLSVPYHGEFNHALCYIGSGHGLFLDGTANYSGIDELPGENRDITAFVLDENGYDLIKIKRTRYQENREQVVTDVYIDQEGNAHLSRSFKKQGVFAAQARYQLQNQARYMDQLSDYWNGQYKAVSVKDLKSPELKINTPVRYQYTVLIPSFLQVNQDLVLLRAFLFISNYYRTYRINSRRTNPIDLQLLWNTHITIRYHLPDSFQASHLPENEQFSHKKFQAVFTYRSLPGKNIIEIKAHINFKQYHVSPDEYSQFRSFTRFIHRKENERIILIQKNK